MALLSLTQLLDAAISTPDAEVVNFRALRKLLQAVLGHLDLQDGSARRWEQPSKRDRARSPAAGQQPQQPGEQLLPAKDSLQGSTSGSKADAAADVGQLLEKVEADGSSSSKDTAAYRDLLEEISQMKEAQAGMQGEIRLMQEALGLGNFQNAATQLPDICDLNTLASDVQTLKERLGMYPDPKEVSNMVHWDVLEDCLVGGKGEQASDGGRRREREGDQSAAAKSPTSDVGTPYGASSVLESRDSSVGLKDPGRALQAPKQQGSIPSGQRRDASTTAVMQTVSQDTQTTSLGTRGTQPASTGTQATTLGTQPESAVTQSAVSGEQPSTQLQQAGPLAAGTLLPAAQGFEISLDTDPRGTCHSQELALPSGSSSAYNNAYECYLETVEALKEIGQLKHLCAGLKEQVAQLEATRLDQSELEKLRLLLQEGGQESVANTLGDLQAQVSSLQGLARDLQGVSRDLQREKGKIRELEIAIGKLEVATASWQTDVSNQLSLLSGSTPQEVTRDVKDVAEQQQISQAALDPLVTHTAEEGQKQLEDLRVTASTGQEEAECPMCSSDTSARLGKLLQCYEKLQGQVDSLMSSKKRGRVVRQLPEKSQDQEELKHMQAAILQMQAEYEKLSSVTGSLLDGRCQQQKDIEGLFQSLERLEKEKADKLDLELEMDEKADKDTLESKVSRAQFEASLELLRERNQEVLSRVAGQEQGLHEVQQQLREEMASKLDRMELGPFQQQLDECWKRSLKQLKELAPPMEADDAAGIRKQLLVDFQCLSCDKQLRMPVPGSPIPPVPPLPPLVPHLTGQYHTVLKTEQTPRERMAECRYPTVPRQCGGQHTLTHPLQRSLHLQLIQASTPQALQPSSLLPSKDKIELLGEDSLRADPCPSAAGTADSMEHRSASSLSDLLQVHQPHPPLQPHGRDTATWRPGRTRGHRLNPCQQAEK